MPGERVFTLPNILTLSRVVGAPILLWMRVEDVLPFFIIITYALFASTDFFDGYLARRNKSSGVLGEWLDQCADKIFVLPFLFYFWQEGRIETVVWWTLVIRETVVIGFRVVALALSERTPALLMGKIKVNCEYVAIGCFFSFYDIAGQTILLAALVFAYISLIQYEMEWRFLQRFARYSFVKVI